MSEKIDLKANLHGRFRVRTTGGDDITPTGKKTQALLAMLLTAPDGTRSRVWLQEKLWSDRDREHGAASLRQALSEIRRSFGIWHAALITNRQHVGLDRSRIELDSNSNASVGEFLEGLDIRDSAFVQWIEGMRPLRDQGSCRVSSLPATVGIPVRARSAIVLRTEAPHESRFALRERLFCDLVAKSLREYASIETIVASPPSRSHGMPLVSIHVFNQAPGMMGIRISIEDVQGHQIWSEFKQCESTEIPVAHDMGLLGLSNRVVDRIVDLAGAVGTAPNGDLSANRMSCLAIQKMFGMKECDLVEADRLLCDAYEIERRGLYQAWRAYLFAIQFVERRHDDPAALVEKADECCKYALEFEPNNSFVLAAVANARRVLTKNYVQSGELAKMAVKANPANPLAWWSLSAAQLYFDDAQTAHHAAVVAQALAQGTPFQYWGDFQRSLTAAATGRFGEAVCMGEASQALAPNFKPPARYLTAIYALTGQKALAERSASRLKDIEEDFSIDRLISDPEYPVSLMRSKELLSREHLMALDIE